MDLSCQQIFGKSSILWPQCLLKHCRNQWEVASILPVSIFPLLFLQNNPFSVANSKYNFHQNDYVRANALKALSRQSIYKVMSCFNIEAVQRIEESSPMTFIQTEVPCLPVEITPLLHLFELTLKASPAGKARTTCPYSGCCWLTDQKSPSLQYAPILDAAHPTIRITGLVHVQNKNVLVIYFEPFEALWSCIETAIWTFNQLVPVEVH